MLRRENEFRILPRYLSFSFLVSSDQSYLLVFNLIFFHRFAFRILYDLRMSLISLFRFCFFLDLLLLFF